MSSANSLKDMDKLLKTMSMKKASALANKVKKDNQQILKLQENLILLKNENTRLKKRLSEERSDIILEIQKINETNGSGGIIDKILVSDLDINLKAEAILKIRNSPPTDLQKNIQWIQYLLNIPFKRYKPLILPKNKSVSEFLYDRYQVLDNSVYGLEKPKKQIIDFLSKLIRNPESKGNVIALQGCPGIGKTKLIKSGISKALDRSFFVINFGGIRDSTTLEGHDFTYVSSRFGRIVDCIIKAGYLNPVIYLDEIDKISENHFEEISGVLTHLLDEEQHSEFYDNYFQGIPIDLSKVLFVISFNDFSKVSSIVNSRMKVISLPNPSKNDKINIAKKFIIPEVISDIGLSDSDITFSDEILELILSKTEEEDGVRKFKRNLQTVIEKINTSNYICSNPNFQTLYSYSETISFPYTVSSSFVETYLDNEINASNLFYYT